MKWQYWITLYIRTHCAARGLRSTTMAAYEASLYQFRAFVETRSANTEPDTVTPRDILEYLEHLRRERQNGDAAVNRQLVIIKNFYRALVAMGHLQPNENPAVHFPKIKAVPKKLPVVLSEEEIAHLLTKPGEDTVLGLRDRALLAILYGTGIRATECASLREGDVDLAQQQLTVTGKGGHQRTIPLNQRVTAALRRYRAARGPVASDKTFFQSLRHGPMSRGAVFQRVRYWGSQAQLDKVISPHRLRHTFATHLVRAGVKLVTIRDLLGHRQISSTQIYLHVTAIDLREAADRHPIQRLAPVLDDLLPRVKIPWQHPPVRRDTG